MTHTPGGLPNDLQAQGLTLSPDFVDPASAYYPEGDVTGGLPITLDSLRDGPPGSKPFYPYSTLIRYAIKGSPAGKLLLEDIYYAIESRFPYFRAAPAGWKNSVRHNLSLNPCFVKVPRPLTDRGKGSYWTVDDNVDPRTGVHRVRKKKTRKGKGGSQDDDPAAALDVFEGFDPSGVARAQQHIDDLHAAFGPTALDEHGQPRVTGFPGAALPFAFDPAYQMQLLGMSLAQAPEQLPVDATGNIDWRMAWHNELASLQRVTAEQDKAPASNEEWYRAMFFRLRAGIFNPFPNDLFGPTAAQPSPMGMDQDPVAQMGTPPDGPVLPS